MNFTTALAHLEAALTERLPGAAAHDVMAPRPRRTWPPAFDIDRIRHAAGLLLIFPDSSQTRLVLTVRAHTLDRHSGQVSLPGGVIEPGETSEQAALREAHEEIGLRVQTVRSLGPLTPIDIPVSGFRLHPIVAAAADRPDLRPSDGEVARILDVSVDELMDDHRLEWRTMTREGRKIDFPAFVIADTEIWGATAMVLAEFLAILGWNGPKTR